MKRLKIGVAALMLLWLLASQGCTTKKDCRGHVKHKLPNGIWI